MRGKVFAATGTVTAILAASSAGALTIRLTDIGGVTAGSQALAGFQAAASFWETALANSVTVDLNVGFSALGPGILGSTSAREYSTSASAIEAQLRVNAASSLDRLAVANLPVLSGGALKVITSGYRYPATTRGGVNTKVQVYDTDGSTNNRELAATSANLKALGFAVGAGADASISFSSKFAFDFTPDDGITGGQIDFIGVAIHEIGHALGFISGVDDYDYYGGPSGPGRGSSLNLNNYAVGSVLDLFRYSADAGNLAPGGAALDWSVKTASYFSVDGGATAYGKGYFSTGSYNGDRRQASHWKDSPAGVPQLGLLDPTIGYGQRGIVTALDLAAFDAIGWNTAVDVVANANYTFATSRNIKFTLSAVPEPATWAMMLAGFGMVGAAMRRRPDNSLSSPRQRG